jgi:hypothetical protein
MNNVQPSNARLLCDHCHGHGYEDTAAGKVACGKCNPAPAYKCETCGDGEWLPLYGVGPHRHVGESFIGSTVLAPKEEWPANYREDSDAPGCGTWSCPDCDGHGVNARPPQQSSEVVSNHQEMSGSLDMQLVSLYRKQNNVLNA